MSFKLRLNIFFRLLKISAKKKIQKFTVPSFRNSLEILLSLCGAGLIKGFSLKTKGNIVVYLRYDSTGAPVVNNIIMVKSNNVKYLSQRELKSMRGMNKVM
jgi:ribosomal protein S8